MIISKANRLTPEQLKEVTAIVESFDCKLQVIVGAHREVYAILGDELHDLLFNRIAGLDYILRVDRIESPYKLLDLQSELASHPIRIGGITLREQPLVIAGHCTIDPKNPDLFYETAAALREIGVHVLRGGVWKPRTMPYSYQGDGKALDIIVEARQRTGLAINLEVMDREQLHLALDAEADMVQVGARNALNYSLLKEIGASTAGRNTVVLLKRSIHMGPVDEFLAAAEYIVAGGNANVCLCPRGTQPRLDGYRNLPDESITQLLQERSWAPVIVDPSHAVGNARFVPGAALAAMAYGADGLCIEAHVDPRNGIGDDPKQAVTPGVLQDLIADMNQVWQLRRRYRKTS
ncbi:MAG: 3-deoxy-D-arabino-heptulosonate 7-phosphate synthase [Opitutales bacterium]